MYRQNKQPSAAEKLENLDKMLPDDTILLDRSNIDNNAKPIVQQDFNNIDFRNELILAKKRLRDAIEQLDVNERYGDRDISVALSETNTASLHLRNLLAYMPVNEQNYVRKSLIKDIVITEHPGCIFKMAMYPLQAAPSKRIYNVYDDVQQALRAFVREHPILMSTKERYTIVYEKVVRGDVVLKRGVSDNDNFEVRRVTNAICDTLLIQDSADKMSFFFTTVQGDAWGMNVYYMLEKDFTSGEFFNKK